VFEALGPQRADALPGLHSITRSDTTGQICGVGKTKVLNAFMKAQQEIIQALSELEIYFN